MSFLYKEAIKELPWVIKHRRFLHAHPELSLKEKNTSVYCQEVMQFLGLKVKPSWGYGFTADIKVSDKKKTIAWRCEMDALAIDEKNTHSFVSKNQEVAHMCGHDVHMAISFLIAKLLMKHKDKLKYNIRFLFQPSEEIPPGGAIGMIKEGCLDGVDEVYALHVDPSQNVGVICIKEGKMTAGTAIFDVEVIGRGSHAATPHHGLDPLYVSCDLVTLWQSIISRRIDPGHAAALSVTKFICGTTFNAIPDRSILAGTIRAFEKEDLSLIQKLMETHLKALELQGFSYIFKYDKTYDPTINTKKGVVNIMKAAKKVIGLKNIITNFIPHLWGEDFGAFLLKKPGAMFTLGSKVAGQDDVIEAIHSPYFDVDEKSMALGACIACHLVV